MADAYTDYLNMTKPEVGASRDTWGDKYNGNFDKLSTWAKATDVSLTAARAVADAALQRAGGIVTGTVVIKTALEALTLAQKDTDDYQWSFYNFPGDNCLYVRYLKAGAWVDNMAYFTRSGDLWLKALGSTAATAIAAAAASANSRVSKAGDDMAGYLRLYNGLEIASGSGETNVWFTRDNVPNTRLVMANDGTFYIHNSVNKNNGYFGFRQDGDMNIPILQTPLSYNTVPPGALMHFAMTTPPAGWLKCNGASIKRASYPRLFAAISTYYGSADDSSFNVPDVRGYFLRPLDDGRGIDKDRGLGSYQASDNLWHVHGYSNGAAYTITNGSGANVASGSYLGIGQMQGAGGGEARPQNIAFPVYIKY